MHTTLHSAAAPIGLDEVALATEVVTVDEQQVLVAWAGRMRAGGGLIQNPVDRTSMSTPYLAASDHCLTARTSGRTESSDELVWVPDADSDQLCHPPDAFWTIRERIVGTLGIARWADDPYKGSFLTSVAAGGDVHTHKDARLAIKGTRLPLLRCNVLVRRPDVGGMPVIEGTELDIPERGSWAFHPTENVHGATPVAGPIDRLTLSFGFVADLAAQWARAYRVVPDIPSAVLQGVRAQLHSQPMPDDRARILERVLAEGRGFTVNGVAGALAVEPAAVWAEVRTTVRLGIVRPVPTAGNRVWRRRML